MIQEQINNISEHLKRGVSDIARKCEVHEDEVILVMSKFVSHKIKKCVNNIFSNSDEYIIIQWPEIQEFMDEEGFDVNSSLANDEWSLEKYGSSAYFVNKVWLDEVFKRRYEDEQADNYLSTIEAHEIH